MSQSGGQNAPEIRGGSDGFGLRINDPAGEERLGISLDDRGRMGIGLDAPPGKGDDRNRERINLVADEDGGAYMAWKDRRTGVVARMYLDDEQKVWMQFSDFTQKPAMIRRYGLSGEEVVRPQDHPGPLLSFTTYRERRSFSVS